MYKRVDEAAAAIADLTKSALIAAGVPNSLSGIGGNVIQSVLLNDFDLVAGGDINLTAGVNALVLDSVGPDTQVHLREIPSALLPPPTPLGTQPMPTLVHPLPVAATPPERRPSWIRDLIASALPKPGEPQPSLDERFTLALLTR